MRPSKRYPEQQFTAVTDGAVVNLSDGIQVGSRRPDKNSSARRQRAIAAPLRPRGYRLLRFKPVLSAICAVVFVSSAATFIIPFAPAVQYRLGHQVSPTQTSVANAASANSLSSVPLGQNRVIIPKIGVSTAILEGPSLDVLNMAEGVWHQRGAYGKGNYVLAGHRFKYLPPNTSTLYNLDKLLPGDTIVIDEAGTRTVYVVRQIKTVSNTSVDILDDGPKPTVTIYTCNDVHETQRVVVVADPLP